MDARTAAKLGLVGYLLWNTRSRWAPGWLLAIVGESESDQAPDVIDLSTLLADQVDQGVASLSGPFSDQSTPDADPMGTNLSAFLTMIAFSEGTDNAGGYGCLYGSRQGAPSTFGDFKTHPALNGWPGVRLTDAQCKNAGFGPGCVSTAAGRYQINKPTFQRLARMLNVTDFSPATQDLMATQLINERGALELVKAGQLSSAVDRVRRIWASLPGAGYGQGERSLAALTSAYQGAGGLVA